MREPTLTETPVSWNATSNAPQHSAAAGKRPKEIDCEQPTSALTTAPSNFTSAPESSTPISSIPANGSSYGNQEQFQDINRYIALGCLHIHQRLETTQKLSENSDWLELLFDELPEEFKTAIGNEASRLLEARWIRLFLHQPTAFSIRSLIRVYVLPEDWGRRFIDRNSKSLKAALRQLLDEIDVSPHAWNGNFSESEINRFDPWASAELVSLYYLFNKLPSPAPTPADIKNRYARAAIRDLLDSGVFSEWAEYGEQAVPGLKTRLYPYQARSASLMVQREAAPRLQLDPRLEVRTSPDGKEFFFGARDGSFLQEPRFYETNRGGILAETMGLGKTVICLAVILATKHHLPQIPAVYQQSSPVRRSVGTLADMAASTLGRYSIPAKAYLEQSEANGAGHMTNPKDALHRNIPFYEIPPDLPRMNRSTRTPPSRQLLLSSATIIVVPRNLLHQWQSEIYKHVLPDGLKILVVDSVPKRGSKTKLPPTDSSMDIKSELPPPTELTKFDVVLFTRNRFEQEMGGQDDIGECDCPYIGVTRIRDCNCTDNNNNKAYESPLRKLHWLRIIIDEGHSFSSSVSKAVLVAKQIQVERRWVVSGTPAKNLVGVEVDMATADTDGMDPNMGRELAIEQRKVFNLDPDTTKATKALGILASNFLQVRPWSDESSTEPRLEWDEYVYRHEHQYRKTYSGFSSCFLRVLEGLVVKTRPEDVEKDIVLPPLRHRVMTANLFTQVLRANAITSERTDVDYLFHKNSIKARHSLIRNLRQSNFTWTGFSLADVVGTLETSSKYLNKEDKNCSLEDAQSLLESSQAVAKLANSEEWKALGKTHEVGIAIQNWPKESQEAFALVYPAEPSMVGVTQLISGQLHVDSNILSSDPAAELEVVGHAARVAITDTERETPSDGPATQTIKSPLSNSSPLQKSGVPSSCVGEQHAPMNRRASAITNNASPQKTAKKSEQHPATSAAPARPKKRKLAFANDTAELAANSPLRDTHIVGTTSAKLTYLVDKVMQHQEKEKIIIFYDGDNAAYYIAQCLELMYINHRIYARTLNNTLRSEYVRLFNEDPDVRVLLIDVACGALGLNLNAASVILIVNPINRPGLEAQALRRAHRIGQTKEVIAETLVLENTIEHAIFNRAKKMSRADHQEAKELEDDAGIVEIIQNAQVLPVDDDESEGSASFALLKMPQQVFGRPNRHKYHRFGAIAEKMADQPKKRARTSESTKKEKMGKDDTESLETPSRADLPSTPPVRDNSSRVMPSIFGLG